MAHGVPVVRASADRLIAAAALARRYPNARIIFTGGSPRLLSDAREADYAAELFESLGISPQRLTMERRARNTQENAEFAKVLAAPKTGQRWLLLTSAYHMPRAVGLFRKAGFAVEPYPVDWRLAGAADLPAAQFFFVEACVVSISAPANGWALRPTGSRAKPVNSSPARTVRGR